MNRDQILQFVVSKIVEKVHPHQIYLFGSQAKGTATITIRVPITSLNGMKLRDVANIKV